MDKLYGPLSLLLWLLGLLATIAAVVGRLAPRLRGPNHVSAARILRRAVYCSSRACFFWER